MHEIQLTPHEIERVADFMRQASGNDFSDKGTLVNSKITILCDRLGYNHFYELWDAMKGSTIAAAQVRQQVIDELTTSYSYFYREKAHFDRIAKLISLGSLPVDNGTLRIWSAGCATGEEVYNIAMTIEDACSTGALSKPYKIVGSDISSKAIEAAKTARYDFANVTRMPPHWRNLYCVRSGQGYDIKGTLKRNLEFRRENVFAPRPDAPFDVVMCRNMMIYFDSDSATRFCSLLRGRVKPGGYLFLGHTEIMSSIAGFTYIEPSIWRRDTGGEDELLLFTSR